MSLNLNLSPMLDSARYAADQGALKAPDADSELREAAEQFEAIFLNEFLKTGKETADGGAKIGLARQDQVFQLLDACGKGRC